MEYHARKGENERRCRDHITPAEMTSIAIEVRSTMSRIGVPPWPSTKKRGSRPRTVERQMIAVMSTAARYPSVNHRAGRRLTSVERAAMSPAAKCSAPEQQTPRL